MALTSANLDFKKFVEIGGLQYRDLFACETPLLKGEELCNELVVMDKREYEIIKLENGEIKSTNRRHFYSKLATITLVVLGIILLLAPIGFIYYAASTNLQITDNQVNLIKLSSICAPITATVSWISAAGMSNTRDLTIENKAFSVSERRFLRLKTKIRALEELLNNRLDPKEKEQINRAKDYFSIKSTHLAKTMLEISEKISYLKNPLRTPIIRINC